MKRYLAIAAHCFRIQIVYRYEVLMNLLEIVGRTVFAWVLWSAIYADRELVGGFTLPAMLLYSLLSAFLSSLDLSEGVSGETSARIRDGTFSRYMVLPTNTQLQFIAQYMGTSAFYALFAGVVTGLCAASLRIGLPFAAGIPAVLCALAMIPLGLVMMVCFHFCIATLTFKYQDIDFFLRVQGALLAFATGGIVPLILLPAGVLSVLRFVPFIHVVYTPAMLLMGKLTLADGAAGLAVLTVWTATLAALGQLMFKRLRTKYDGVGI